MMRRGGILFPALGMVLLYCALYIGLIIVNLRGTAKAGGEPFALLHFAVAALAAAGLYRAAKKGFWRLRACAVPLALLGLACAVLPSLPDPLPTRIFNARPPVLGPITALFMPVALTLFFRATQAGREGVSFGLVMVCGELLWALLFPLLSDVVGKGLVNLQAFHLFSLNCWLVAVTGLCLGAALYWQGDTAGDKAHKRGFEAAAEGGESDFGNSLDVGGPCPSLPDKRALLFPLFTACTGMFVLMGLHMGMLLPKMALEPKLIALPHLILVALLPAAQTPG